MVASLIREVGVANAKKRLRARVSMVDAQESMRLYFHRALEERAPDAVE